MVFFKSLSLLLWLSRGDYHNGGCRVIAVIVVVIVMVFYHGEKTAQAITAESL
jgi:hypothetical protein